MNYEVVVAEMNFVDIGNAAGHGHHVIHVDYVNPQVSDSLVRSNNVHVLNNVIQGAAVHHCDDHLLAAEYEFHGHSSAHLDLGVFYCPGLDPLAHVSSVVPGHLNGGQAQPLI
jgi:hypothetical protein